MDNIRFINEFNHAMSSNQYLTMHEQNIEVTASKPSHFKTSKVIEKARAAFAYLAKDLDTCNASSLTERIACLNKMRRAISIYEGRVKTSLEKRIWYKFLSFFGYEAPALKNIRTLSRQIDHQLSNLPLPLSTPPLPSESENKIHQPQEDSPLIDQLQQESKESFEPPLNQPDDQAHDPHLVVEEPTESDPLHLQTDELAPFNFAGLGEDLQRQVYSHLPFPTLFQMRQTSTSTNERIDAYLSDLYVNFSLMQHLEDTSTDPVDLVKQKKYFSYLQALLRHPNLENLLKTNEPFKTEFLAHFVSPKRPAIDWNQCEEDEHAKLLNLFFIHASNTELETFLSQNVCATREDFSWGYTCPFLSFSKTLVDHLTDEKKERLLALSPKLGTSFIKVLAQVRLPYDIKFQLVTTFWNKWPNLFIWVSIEDCFDYEPLIGLRHCVIAQGILNLLTTPLKDFALNPEQARSQFKDQIDWLLKKFPTHDGGQDSLILMLDLVARNAPSLEKEREKWQDLFTVCKTHYLKFRLFEALMRYEQFDTVEMGLQEEIRFLQAKLSQDKGRVSISDMDYLMKWVRGNWQTSALPSRYLFRSSNYFLHLSEKPEKTEQLAQFAGRQKWVLHTFIKAVQSCPEPLQTFFLRYLAPGEHEFDPIDSLQNDWIGTAFQDFDLPLGDFPSLLTFKEKKKAIKLVSLFLILQKEIPTLEHLESFLKKIENLKGKKIQKILNALVGGMRLPNGQVIKPAPQIDEDTMNATLRQHKYEASLYAEPLNTVQLME